ncbi:putative ABC transport system ATP-binding protein [Paenibacillus castaneae]|uniref:ATP-binding cassette domain-containing protein n=1 Tax=Paenibacillus castaneae TaxID=474957 RepID=UPI000C9B63F8|nr:ATP-binding cassette domain-containing protein [Paenibacillus castaneae]NIK77046.1 putative ABC transport system ATP-binding protein [Paenibacillus castaneae]
MGVLTLNNVTYKYEGTKKYVLNGVDASFEAGKVYTIVGKSGSGKSSLLSLIAGLDICTGGTILHGDHDIKNLNRDEYRAKGIGVVFQSFNLLTNSSAIENIVLSMNISESKEVDKKAFAYALLEKVGIDRETADRKILKLSGGEQQRVGIARAISHNPEIVIADEPTGNLDSATEEEILNIFSALAHDEGKCVIIVTHSKKVTTIADVIYGMSDGKMAQMKKRD